MKKNRIYIAIDLKSFFASVECISRGLDPLSTNLVVADRRRTEKTICLAVTPSLKNHGISGRARLFEVVQRVNEVNCERRSRAPHRKLVGSSYDAAALIADPSLAVDYLVAPPRMALYIEYSTRIYNVYLRHIAPEDIHVYSIDEVFMDVTDYLTASGCSAHDFARRVIRDVLEETGITATAGIGTNLYLAKIAMDIVAKRVSPDADGVRIAELDEQSYRERLWTHRPLTDFWRVGRGYARKLESHGMYTMGDVARCSVENEALLYQLFGVNAELLIDHAWGWEPCRLSDIRAYKPENSSIVSGQVLQEPYTFEQARLVVREMADALSLDLVKKGLVTDQIVLTVGYDIENLADPERRRHYRGEIVTDHYGRAVPKHAHGTGNLGKHTASTRKILDTTTALYDRIMDKTLLVRRMSITANHLLHETEVQQEQKSVQLDLFTDYTALEAQKAAERAASEREHRVQVALIDIQDRYGKNAILKGMNYLEGATARERNGMIGGHRAGSTESETGENAERAAGARKEAETEARRDVRR